MLMSTHTGVGKHTLACGILRSLSRQGIKASPFKAVSVDTHTCILPDGAEISFAQALQAASAGVVPSRDMNPYVALYGDEFALVERGKRMESRPDMVTNRQYYLSKIEECLRSAAQQSEMLVIEGAGSPVELGLEDVDLVNIPVARMADAKVLLVTEMVWGGGYASVVGTWALLPEDVRANVVGIVLNKFDLQEPLQFADEGVRRLSEIVERRVMTFPLLADTHVPGELTSNNIHYDELLPLVADVDKLADLVDEKLDIGYLMQVLGIAPEPVSGIQGVPATN
jgi:adenosylcobyric acid synthase